MKIARTIKELAQIKKKSLNDKSQKKKAGLYIHLVIIKVSLKKKW